jgi:hypothetical protein
MKAMAARGIATILNNSRACVCRSQIFWSLAAATGTLGFCGCGGNGGGGATTLSIDPSVAAHKAIELYDKDSSGTLSEAELSASPGLLAALDRYDKDGDRQISRDEIEERLQSIVATGTGWLTVNCRVLQAGRPLAGATIRFVPDACMENALLPATGTTDTYGQVSPAVADTQLPDEKKGLQVMQPGIYRVEVKHANVKQPHKPLGCEIDEIARGGTEPVLRL